MTNINNHLTLKFIDETHRNCLYKNIKYCSVFLETIDYNHDH